MAAAAVMLSLGGAGYWWDVSHEQQKTIDEVEVLLDKYAPIGSAQAETPGGRENLRLRLTWIAEHAQTDKRYAEAFQKLKEGKPAEAEPMLRSAAEEMEAAAQRDYHQAAEAWRNAGVIALLADPARSLYALRRALRLEPDDPFSLASAGGTEERMGDLPASETHFRHLAELPVAANDGDPAWQAQMGLGAIAQDRGNLVPALADFHAGLGIAERLALRDPNNATWQRDVANSHQKIGDVLMIQGRLPRDNQGENPRQSG
jgi:tetratricopeptide (TPR) repeat protein